MKVPKGGSVYEDGKQYCDPTPVELPLGYQHPETLESLISRMCTDRLVQMELSKQNGGQDSEEEADDFEVSGDEDIDFESTGHEMTEMQEEYVDLSRLRADSEAHAEREIAERMAEETKRKEKQKVKRSRKDRSDSEEDAPVEDAQ